MKTALMVGLAAALLVPSLSLACGQHFLTPEYIVLVDNALPSTTKPAAHAAKAKALRDRAAALDRAGKRVAAEKAIGQAMVLLGVVAPPLPRGSLLKC